MALIRFNDNTREQAIDHARSLVIWSVLTGEQEPENDAQARFCERINKIYLDRHAKDCPASYLQNRAGIHALMDGITPVKEYWNK